MEILFSIIALLVGCLLLYKGADWLINSSVKLALSLGISRFLIGITVVAFATSLPELLVTSLSAFGGHTELGLGNIIGSCIFNLAVVIGLSAIIRPISIGRRDSSINMIALIATNIIFTLVILDGMISHWDGIVMLAIFTFYLGYLIISEKRSLLGKPKPLKPPVRVRNILLMLLGFAGLAGGAQLLVMSASYLARQAGVDELVIGITVVAMGTSLPEITTSLLANARKDAEISFANVVGSNIANILLVLGFVAVVQSIPAAPTELTVDIAMLHGITVLVLGLFLLRKKLGRIEGVLMLVVFAAYIVYQYLR